MSKFNTSTARARAGAGPIKSESTPTLQTFNGAPGFARDSKSELFLAAVSDFGGEGSFYESAKDRSARIARLTQDVAVQDAEWLTSFTNWLREEANMRTISLTIALEGAKALNKAGIPGGRKLVSGAIRRADEAGEALAWWMASVGRKIPSAVKRGIADGAVKSFNEYSLAKYDTASHGFRFGDVIELVHPSPKDEKQSDLFKFALDRRRDASAEPSESLTMLGKRKAFLALSSDEQKALVNSGQAAQVLKDAGLTWEVLSSAYGKGGLDAKAWEAMIPSMGYMALLRNLRNFEEKGVSEATLDQVAARIADTEEVAKSRQLPFRFLAAYNANSGSLRWGFPLEKALNASLENVPALEQDTLILVDRSGSMFQSMSQGTDLTFADAAAIFGIALAKRAENATLVQFGTGSATVEMKKTDSVLTTLKGFRALGGTATSRAIAQHFDPKKHKRVVLVTDEQANGSYHTYTGDGSSWASWQRVRGNVLDSIPANVPTYTWNLAGYAAGHGESTSNRTYLGGLSDQAFKLIPLLEAGRDAGWPWETN
jgi:hypothetical protein